MNKCAPPSERIDVYLSDQEYNINLVNKSNLVEVNFKQCDDTIVHDICGYNIPNYIYVGGEFVVGPAVYGLAITEAKLKAPAHINLGVSCRLENVGIIKASAGSNLGSAVKLTNEVGIKASAGINTFVNGYIDSGVPRYLFDLYDEQATLSDVYAVGGLQDLYHKKK